MSEDGARMLARWVAHRDADAFAEIISRYSGLVYWACRRITGNAVAAEDLSQECFLKLSQQTRSIREPGAWLHRVATCAAISWLRSEKRRALREERYAREQATEDGDQTEEDWRALMPLVDEAINALPDKTRAAIVLRFLQGKTHADIARELGVSRRAVQKRIDKGLTDLRGSVSKSVSGLTVPALAAMLSFHTQANAAPAPLLATLGRQVLSAAQIAPRLHAGWLIKGWVVMSSKKAVSIAVVAVVLLSVGRALFYNNAVSNGSAPPALSEAYPDPPALSADAGADGSGGSGATALQTTALDAGAPDSGVEAASAADEVNDTTAADADDGPNAPAPQNEPGVASVTGVVYTADMRPAPGARVWVESAESEQSGVSICETTSDEEGKYTLPGLPCSRGLDVYVRANGYLMQIYSIWLPPGADMTLDFTLMPSIHYVRGHVVTASGAAVPGAEVNLQQQVAINPDTSETGMMWAPGHPRSYFAITEEDGAFEMASPFAGSCTLRVMKEGIGESLFPGIPTGTEDARLVLEAYGTIAGAVTFADGSPAAGYAVSVVAECAFQEGMKAFYYPVQDDSSCTTDDSGRYVLENLAPNTMYQLGVTKQPGEHLVISERGHAFQPLAVKFDLRVDGGQRLDGVDFQIPEKPHVKLYGRITDHSSGNPAKGVNLIVCCTRSNPGRNFGAGTSDADGRYELTFTVDAKSLLEVKGSYSAMSGMEAPIFRLDGQPSTVTLSPGEEKELNVVTDAPADVPVRVVDGAGMPLSNMFVGVWSLNEDGTIYFASSTGVMTDRNGQCTIKAIAPGVAYVVWVQAAGTRGGPHIQPLSQSEPVTMVPDETAAEVVLVVEEKGGLEGMAVFADGSPAANVPLTIEADGAIVTTTTRDDGAFTAVIALVPGTYDAITLSTEFDEGATWSATVSNIQIGGGMIVDIGIATLLQAP